MSETMPNLLAPRTPWWRRRRTIVALLVVIAVGAWGVSTARSPRVRAVRPERRDVVESVVASGRVLAPARVSVGAQVGGVAKAVAVREGDRVKAGQLLLELDDRELQAAVAQAQAALASAGAGLARVETVTGEVATEDLRQAGIAVKRAEEELTRQRQLFKAGAGTRRELEDAERALTQAQSQARAAQARLSDAGPAGAERRRVGALRSEAEAALRLTKTRLLQARLVASSDGVVLDRKVEPGDLVQPGRELFVIAPEGETRLVAQIDEKELLKLVVGQHVLASVEAAPDRLFGAEVSWIAPAIDPQRATVEVRLRVPEPPKFLLPDMTVSIDVQVGRKAGAVVLPIEAVRDRARGPWVLVARDGKAARVPVTLGLRGAGFVEVTSGLAADATVIPVTERAAKEGGRVRVDVAESAGPVAKVGG